MGGTGPDQPDGREPTRRWRPNVWLATLSTVVAVATGMFSLRDQIFPREAGTATASIGLYERSVGDICAALNRSEKARKADALRLRRRLGRAATTLAQRNALLDSNNQVLGTSRHLFARFRSLDVPKPRRDRHAETEAAWRDIVTTLGDYSQRVDAATNRRDLVAANKTLPRARRALSEDYATREANLTNLGGGLCTLKRQIAVPSIALPELGRRRSSSGGPVASRRLKGVPGQTPEPNAGSSDPRVPPPPPPPPIRSPDVSPRPGAGPADGGG